MEEVPQIAQTPAESTGVSAPPQDKKFNIKRFLDVGSWAALFVLTPAFFIAFLSQNSLPGDLLYPVKRGIENSLIAAASVSPATKAVLLSDISDRRFTEADTLLLSQANTEPLNDLVAQVESAETAIDNVSDPAKQEELTAKVIAQIEDYQAKLTSTAAKIESSPSPFAQAPTQAQTQTQTQITPTKSQVVATAPVVTSAPTPTPTQTQTQTAFVPTQGSQQSVTQPTEAPIPTQQTPSVSVPPPAATPLIEEQKKEVEQAVEITKIRLEKVKKDLEEKSKQREERKEKEKSDNDDNSRRENRRQSNNSSREN